MRRAPGNGGPLLFYDTMIGNFACMKRQFVYGMMLSALLVQACGSDRQMEQQHDAGDQHQLNEQAEAPSNGDSLDVLLGKGVKYDQPFVPGNGQPSMSLVFLESNQVMDSSLRADGFDGPLDMLAVYTESVDGEVMPQLLIRKDGIFDGAGNRLVDQVPAKYGYAWRVGTGAEESLLGNRSFVSVIILDEDGIDASDELYIYWKNDGDKPAGFFVTNIPNEIL